jgi:hypothetical protein
MQALKVFGLGTLFLILLVVLSFVVAAVRGNVQHGTAVGLSALRVGTVYNPLFWLTLIVAYGAAYWIVKRYARQTPTS